MFVYLDESGDPGFKFNRGSSKYFVITLLLVDDPIPIQSCIDDYRLSVGFGPQEEFKFHRSSKDIRYGFLRQVVRNDFQIRALVIDKELMTRPHMRNRDTFYHFLVRLVLQHDNGTIQDATLVLDQSVKNKKSQQAFSTYLRKALNSDPANPRVRKIVHHDSKGDNLIQATDMVGGAIYRRYAKADETYFRIIRPKVQDCWEWHPSTA